MTCTHVKGRSLLVEGREIVQTANGNWTDVSEAGRVLRVTHCPLCGVRLPESVAGARAYTGVPSRADAKRYVHG